MDLILTNALEQTLILPPTLMVKGIMHERDYQLHRAPFASRTVVSGDGGRIAAPFNVTGKVYFDNQEDADAWIQTLASFQPVEFQVGPDAFDVHALDFIAVPVLLPRILNVNIRIFPL